MSYTLMDFQAECVSGCYAAYRQGARVVMPVLPTGAGKTVVMGHIAHEYAGFGLSIAHRGVLVGQMSLALAREGVRHDIIAPDALIKTIVAIHMDEVGKSYYDQRASWACASVDTIIKREFPKGWRERVGMVMIDEGHHILRHNKWGRAFAMFPNAYGLTPSASPDRADGMGLGSHADGIVDALVEGPGLRWMIDQGHLTNYVIRGVKPSDLEIEDVEITATGDFNQDKMRKRVKQSNKIVGDVVDQYRQWCMGKKGITFAVDVEHANEICAKFNAVGISAVVVTDKTPETERRSIMKRFAKGDLMMLINVDLFGEGMDVPVVEVVIMARPTASFPLYLQQFGRALRLLVSPILRAAWHTYTAEQRRQFIAASLKPYATIIDLVGNIIRHNGPPDWRTEPWSLDARCNRNPVTDGIPMRACANPMCLQPFLRIYPSCPSCGWTPEPPADRSRPEFVDGDTVLYTPELLQELFGKRDAIMSDFCPIPYGMDHNSIAARGIKNRHLSNQQAQRELRAIMNLALPPNVDPRINDRKFFHQFGVDTLTAQGLPSAQADELRQRIHQRIARV